jgi:predicted RNA-binding protein YlqC (UPF0109 family)
MNGIVLHGLLTSVAMNLVDHLEQVLVTMTAWEGGYSFDVQVAEGDLGKLAGKQGRTARSIRTIGGAVAMKMKTTVSVNIVALPLG